MKSHLSRSRAVGRRTGRATPGLPSSVAGRRSLSVGWARFAFPVLVGAVVAASAAGPASASSARVFELVSPASKGGSDVSSGYFATSDGNAVGFETFAALGDPDHALYSSTYVARRAADGWKTTSMQAAVLTPNPTLLDAGFTAGLSADLSAVFSAGWAAYEPGDENEAQDIARVRDGVSEWVTPAQTLPDTNLYVDSNVAGASADGRYFVVSTTKPMLAGVPGGSTQLYLRSPEGLELASRLPNGTVPAGARLGNDLGFQGDNRAISADGRTLFFTSSPGVSQLYMRRDGVTTLISANAGGAPGTAASVYRAATEDGSRVLFSSTSQLTADAPVGGGLYRYDVETDQLRLMVAGGIRGVMQTSDDLSIAYVVSNSQLVPGTGTLNQPNLFRVGDSSVGFIATLDGQDQYGWTWGQGGNVSGVSADGSRLVFQTRAELAGADLRPGRVGVYRYDAAGDSLACISCHPDGTVSQGASLTSADVSFGDKGANPTRAITADGRLAVFETADALLPEDENELADVYGYDDEGLQLISGGTPDGESHAIDVSADGRDVFFLSNASLAPDDVDNGYRDVYTARIGGGFPSTDEPCTASSCERPDAPATGFTSVIGSTAVFDQPADLPIASTTTFRVGSLTAASRRAWARKGRSGLKVRVSAAAKITVTTRRAGKTIAKTSASRASAGTSTLTLKLSKSAAAQLKRTGRLTVTVTVTVSGATKAQKATVKLVAPKAKKASR